VPERDEVHVLGQPIHHRQDYRLTVDVWKAFDEVHRYVAPHRGRNEQWLQEAGWMKLLSLVLLAGGAGARMIAHHRARVGDEEVCRESMQHFLHSFMTHVGGTSQQRREAWRVRWHVHSAMDQDESVDDLPFVTLIIDEYRHAQGP
jgi:hypothetical protein